MNKALHLLVCLILLSVTFSNAQTNASDKPDKITTAVQRYFEHDREIIHLHLNKAVYLSNETIWFKGYITEKKLAAPYGLTANVYVQLLDSEGKYVQSNLHYAENSTFEGYVTLDETLPTGQYFLQAYTNYMNNFSEDESSIYAIEIINPSENKIVDTKRINYESAEIQFFPESGVFLQGVTNTFGIRIQDCNSNGIAVAEGSIRDPKGNLITTFTTNEYGYGRFDIVNAKNDIYTATFTVNGKKSEKMLPLPKAQGITFSVNNYALANKTVVTVKTNPETLRNDGNGPYSLVVQKADIAPVIDIEFKDGKPEQTLIIPSIEIPEGLNTLYLIDKNRLKIAERSIYNSALKNRNSDVTLKTKGTDSIVFNGKSSLKLGSLSISVLPVDSRTQQQTIYSKFLFDNSLLGTTENLSYYLNDLNRRKQFELDNLLLTKSSKYDWNLMLNNTDIAIKHPFDSGLTIKGTINAGVNDPNDFKIKMNSYLGGNAETTINEKKEFHFNNLIAVDSSTIHFSLLNKRQKSTTLKMYPQLVDNNRKFYKQFRNRDINCIQIISDDIDLPKIGNAIALENITIEAAVKRDVLEKTSRYGNSMARGFKVTEQLAGNYLDVLSFLQAHGYKVSQNGADVIITNRSARSFMGSNSPVILIDDIPLDDFGFLRGYSLKNIDEIYINTRGYGMGMNGALGEIRIYTKITNTVIPNITIKSQSMLVTNGFQRWKTFENPKYDNVHDIGFKKYGTIHWIPNVDTDPEGNFKFAIPNLYQQNVVVTIEGISSTGEIFSETRIIEIP